MPADGWPERRKNDPTARLEAVERAIGKQGELLETLDSKLTSLVTHIQSGFNLDFESRHPYTLRAGMDDLSAIDTNMLLWLRDSQLVLETLMARRQQLMSQIRNGKYDPDQPAAPKKRGMY